MVSTATEWLELHPGSWAELQTLLEIEGISISAFMEYPNWMKDEIAKQLADTFSQPYWDDIQRTFFGDAEKYLASGLARGESISEMAVKIASSFKGGITTYALDRAKKIARTESGNALNGARKLSINHLMEETDLGGVIKTLWRSILGTTTRDTHANLDGVPADKNGMWNLSGYIIPWPSHTDLPVQERINCQCTIVTEYGMQDQEAYRVIDDYNTRVEERNRELREKTNP